MNYNVNHRRLWRDTLDARKFWKWARLVINLNNFPEQEMELIQSLIKSRKMALVTEIKIGGATKLVVESVLRAVIEGTTTNLKALYVNLEEGQGSTDAALLSRAALKVETFSISGEQGSQVQAIITAVTESDVLTLKNLDLGLGSLADVSPDILGIAAVKLETLSGGGSVSSAQFEEILTRLAATEESKLEKLEVDVGSHLTPDLTHMDPDILTSALLKLETDILLRVRLSPEQTTHLLTKISNTRDLRLTRVNLDDVSLVPLAVLSGAISRLEKVIFSGSDLTPVQLEAVFTMLAIQQPGGSKLKRLGFGIGETDLSGLSPELLLGAISRLEGFALYESNLTAEQLEAVFTMLASQQPGGSKLKILGFGETDLSGLSPELLLGAISRLEEFGLYGTTLTEEQVNAILSMVI